MAVTYPRALPSGFTYSDAEFDLIRYVNRNELDGGQTQVVDYAPARWRVTYTTRPFRLALKHELEAWWNSLREGMNTFLGHDPFRPKPFEYHNTAIPSTAGGFLADLANDHIQFGGLPGSFWLRTGDWIGLVEGGKYALHRTVEQQQGNGSIEVEPWPLTTVFTTAATFDFDAPVAEFLPEYGSFDISRSGALFVAQWSGIQKLY